MSTEKIIHEAISTGEVLTIRYHGGSSPGATRQIAPIRIMSNGTVQARCFTSDAVKPFFIRKIEILSPQPAKSMTWTGQTPKTVDSASAIDEMWAELEKEPPAPETHELVRTANAILVIEKKQKWRIDHYRHFSIFYENQSETISQIFDPRTKRTYEERTIHKYSRPWAVHGSRRFKNPNAAFQAFLKDFRALSGRLQKR